MSTASLNRLYDLLLDRVGKETAENLKGYFGVKVKNSCRKIATLKRMCKRQQVL